MQLKHFLRLIYGDALSVEARQPGEVPVFGSNGRVGWHDYANTLAPAIVVGRKGSHGKVTWSPVRAFCIDTTYYVDGRSCSGDLRFAYYLLLSLNLDQLSRDTGVPGLERDSAHSRSVNIPDLATQKRIAAFLDRETARIDALIEKKERLVALLEEREERSIAGILSGEGTECRERKRSPAPWLQNIPKEWEVVPLRHLVQIKTGSRDTKDREDEGAYPFYVRSMNVERINSYSFDEEAVLTSGDGAGVGTVFHHVNCKFDLHQRMYAFTNFNRVTGRYFYFFLRAFFKLQMTQWSAKSTVDSVRMPFLKTLLVTVPPEHEQKRLVETIELRAGRDALLKEKTNTSIDRLREYRAALITAAVTGQIDVDDYARRGGADRRLDEIEAEMS